MNWPRQISTDRLLLREPRPADAPALFEGALGQPEVLRWVGFKPHTDVQQTRRQLDFEAHRWLRGSGWLWVLGLRTPQAPDGEAVGQVELTPLSQPAAQAFHLRLGYVLAQGHGGQGLMSEAVSALLAEAWRSPAVWRVDALCDVDNAASARLLSRVGLQLEGRLQRAVSHPQASPHPRDAWLFGRGRPPRP